MATQSPIRSPTKTQPLANRDPNTTSPSKSTSKPTFTVTDTDTDTSKMEKPDLMPHPTKQQWNKMEERRRQNVEERMLGGAGVTEYVFLPHEANRLRRIGADDEWKQREANIHLPLRHDHVTLHGQVERIQGQAVRKVRNTSPPFPLRALSIWDSFDLTGKLTC